MVEIKTVIGSVEETVRKLDAIVRNKYANNPAPLAEWTSASHTERAPRRSTPAAQTQSTGATGAAAPSSGGIGSTAPTE